MYWNDWSLDRIVVLFVSLAFLLIGIQVTLYHYRQNFHHKAMWLPVLASPVFFVAGIILTWYNASWLHTLFLVLMYVGAVAGLIGVYFHFRGVGIRVGGWALRNFMIGPPVILPMVFTAVSVLGLIALYWKGM
ncbi:hypothetical protein MJA45_14210 [Paenibacillus aurantius]|uniref:Uncharacterized protein n=1 Tax=Paenibacillus aurantius TaxID=2918900 RepID=A0AA96LHX9_9BACL|nr:hypothetical protein [Paenibacillus aurantius]WNQ14121.1 hypothetical protein MJA45_14210 [Paenibacillus aurantius]